jgi:hypothetical protein
MERWELVRAKALWLAVNEVGNYEEIGKEEG